jgi:hypothetical protein
MSLPRRGEWVMVRDGDRERIAIITDVGWGTVTVDLVDPATGETEMVLDKARMRAATDKRTITDPTQIRAAMSEEIPPARRPS